MTTGKKQELKYFEKLNISVLAIDKIKDLIKSNIINTIRCWEKGKNVQKNTFHIIGPAGVGKTQICGQIRDELTKETGKKWNMIMIKSPVLSRDDFLIPFPITDNGNTKFKMLYSDFVPTEEDSCGLFVIDEFSRGDHNLQQLMWQVQNEYKLHLYNFPKHWFVICTDNPDDQEYSMDYLEDAAGLRRTLHIYTEVSAAAFLRYARAAAYHPLVIEFIEAHPEYVYDFDSQRVGSVYANPASWEKVSDILWGFEMNGGVEENLSKLDPLASGLLNTNKTRLFIDYIKSREAISPRDILDKYDSVRNTIMKYVKEGHNVRLGQLMDSFISYLVDTKPNLTDGRLSNIGRFICEVPSDTAAILVTKTDSYDRKSDEFKYMTKVHTSLFNSSQDYKKKFYETMTAIGDKAASNEALKKGR